MDHSQSSRRRKKRDARPLDETALRDLAFGYVARFATTSGKLASYLGRKVRERGWAGESEDRGAEAIAAIAEEFGERGYVDDAAWARDKTASLRARGYGGRRIDQTLRAAGVDARAEEPGPHEASEREAAVTLARRRRFGPFGTRARGEEGRRQHEKQLAAMMRAGHDFRRARHVLEAAGPEDLDGWVAEAEQEFGK